MDDQDEERRKRKEKLRQLEEANNRRVADARKAVGDAEKALDRSEERDTDKP